MQWGPAALSFNGLVLSLTWTAWPAPADAGLLRSCSGQLWSSMPQVLNCKRHWQMQQHILFFGESNDAAQAVLASLACVMGVAMQRSTC